METEELSLNIANIMIIIMIMIMLMMMMTMILNNNFMKVVNVLSTAALTGGPCK